MKPTREDVRTMADELDMYAEDAALMAFARHWYAAGQKDQRERDVWICYAMAASYETCHANRCADAIRSQSNDD